jgi:TPR repeat protein
VGVSHDNAMATRLFLLAAEQGEVHSHDWLGHMYSSRAPSLKQVSSFNSQASAAGTSKGTFFEPSEDETLRRCQRAADMGYEHALNRQSWRLRGAFLPTKPDR